MGALLADVVGAGVTGSVVAAARAWRDEDPDPETRAEVDRLLTADEGRPDVDALADRFGARLQFGTAGLRGEMGAGPNRMNRAVVVRATAGLAAYLTATGPRGRAGDRGLRRPAPVRPLRPGRGRGAGRAPASPSTWPTGRCRPRSWRSGSPTSAAAPACRSPPATTRRATTATRSTWATAPRSCRRPTPRSRRRSMRSGRSTRWRVPPTTTRGSSSAGDGLVDAYVAGALAQAGAPAARPRRPTWASCTRRCTGSGRDVVLRVLADAGFAAVHRRRRAGRSRPRLPDRRLPQPRGARRARPGPGRRPGRRRRRRHRQRPRRRPTGGGAARTRGGRMGGR